eukprot:gene2323-502_t
MAGMLRDALCPSQARSAVPRVLGLTASFVHGATTNLTQKREKLEMLTRARIHVPKLTGQAGRQDIQYKAIRYPNAAGVDQNWTDSVERFTKELSRLRLPVKNAQQLSNSAEHVLGSLGASAYSDYLRTCVVPQLRAAAMAVAQYSNDHYSNAGQNLAHLVPQLQEFLESESDRMCGAPATVSPKCKHSSLWLTYPDAGYPQVQKLFSELSILFSKHPGRCGIVFVERVCTTLPLCHLLQTHFRPSGLDVLDVSGAGSMRDNLRESHLQEFRQGRCKLLVCTAALEEGLDVPECSFVVRFDEFKTTKSHVQGSGRARQPNAEVLYFENVPENEEIKREWMEAEARTAPTVGYHTALVSQKQKLAEYSGRVHPLHSSDEGGEVNIFNCTKVVYEYVAKIWGSFEPSKIIQYSPDSESMSCFQYPSPTGVVSIHATQVDQHWAGVDVQKVDAPERYNNLSSSDLDKMRFLYAVCADMVQRDLLTSDFSPKQDMVEAARLRCPPPTKAESIKLKPGKFVRGGAQTARYTSDVPSVSVIPVATAWQHDPGPVKESTLPAQTLDAHTTGKANLTKPAGQPGCRAPGWVAKGGTSHCRCYPCKTNMFTLAVQAPMLTSSPTAKKLHTEVAKAPAPKSVRLPQCRAPNCDTPGCTKHYCTCCKTQDADHRARDCSERHAGPAGHPAVGPAKRPVAKEMDVDAIPSPVSDKIGEHRADHCNESDLTDMQVANPCDGTDAQTRLSKTGSTPAARSGQLGLMSITSICEQFIKHHSTMFGPLMVQDVVQTSPRLGSSPLFRAASGPYAPSLPHTIASLTASIWPSLLATFLVDISLICMTGLVPCAIPLIRHRNPHTTLLTVLYGTTAGVFAGSEMAALLPLLQSSVSVISGSVLPTAFLIVLLVAIATPHTQPPGHDGPFEGYVDAPWACTLMIGWACLGGYVNGCAFTVCLVSAGTNDRRPLASLLMNLVRFVAAYAAIGITVLFGHFYLPKSP